MDNKGDFYRDLTKLEETRTNLFNAIQLELKKYMESDEQNDAYEEELAKMLQELSMAGAVTQNYQIDEGLEHKKTSTKIYNTF